MELLSGEHVVSHIENECLMSMRKIGELGLKPPHIHVFQFGNDPSSSQYVKRIARNCLRFGIKFDHMHYLKDKDEFCRTLMDSCNNSEISAVMVQQPLPKDLLFSIDYIPFVKDVEGITTVSMGRLFRGEPALAPCTAEAVMEILDFYDISLEGRKVAIVGRSNIVGKPLTMLLLDRNATVKICHSKTKYLAAELKIFEIIIVAIGKANFITTDSVNPNSIVIDVCTNYTESNRLVGDVNFDKVRHRVSRITPVPGGVGLVTNIMLIKNIINAYKFQHPELEDELDEE